MSESATAVAAADDPLQPLLQAVIDRFGESLDAVFLYGSWRRGRRDTLPDFYVLLDRYPPGATFLPGKLLPPTVLVMRGGELRAKVTVLRTDQLRRAVASDFHPYFWARFAQPAPLLFVRDAAISRICEAIQDTAAARLTRIVASWWQGQAVPAPESFWQQGFTLTYAAELRSETAERIASLYRADQAHYDALYRRFSAPQGGPLSRLSWRLRQITGKVLSAVRIVKAVFTFAEPLDYLAWKVGRQSGVVLEPSERARRWPLVFGWAFIWRLWRAGGFR